MVSKKVFIKRQDLTIIWRKGITPIRRKSQSPAFTIIELLVSVAIIGLMIGLLIPNIDRSLNKNQIVNDVELFKAKLEETRLLAGSTQQVDENLNSNNSSSDEAGYYAVLIPSDANNYFGIVKIAYPAGTPEQICSPEEASSQLNSGAGECVVERVGLSKNIQIIGAGVDQYFAYRVPTQKLSKLELSGATWSELSPVFGQTDLFQLTYTGLKAKVRLEDYTARVTVIYEKQN